MAGQSLGSQRTIRSVSLQRLLELTPLSPAEVVYVTLSLLEELAGNHGEYRRLLTPGDVRITDAGDVLLAERETAPPAHGDDAVSAVGRMLVPALAAQDPLLEVALDSLSMGALGRSPMTAAAALSHQLPALTSPDVLAQARADLGAFVRRLHSPGAEAPFRQPPPKEAIEVGTQPPMALIGVGVVVLVILAIVLTIAGNGGLSQPPKAADSRALPTPSSLQPTTEPTTIPTPMPTPVAYVPPAPPAGGRMRGVTLTPASNCQVGSRCAATVELRFAGAGAPTALTWRIVFYDACDGTAKPLGAGSFSAPAGWNHVVSDASVTLPQDLHGGRLVAVTSSPDAVASDPLEVVGPGCS